MSTAYLTHPEFVLHDMGPGHPEQPARLHAIEAELKNRGIMDRLRIESASPASEEQVLLAHSRAHLENLRRIAPVSGSGVIVPIDADTYMNDHTLDAAMLAAGAVIRAVDLVIDGEIDNAFCAVRPPGHHAERERAMGFCFFNNMAIAAKYAILRRGIARVAILDFDVHHGNGTEDIVRGDERILLCSSFQHPLYPGTPFERDPRRMVNVPLHAGTGSANFRSAVKEQWFNRLETFAPELILISAGFDAHREDPLGQVDLTEEDYAWVTREALGIARRHGKGRLVSALEGGYHLEALGRSVAAHIEALLAGESLR